MVREQTLMIDGLPCLVTISDEEKALLAAYAAGGAVVGIWDGKAGGKGFWLADYLVRSEADVDEEFLERVVRRRKGLPWIIAVTKRLRIREMIPEDWEWVRQQRMGIGDGFGDRNKVFADKEAFISYLSCQYGFYEYGIWAVLEQETGAMVGMAGLTDLSWPQGRKASDERLQENRQNGQENQQTQQNHQNHQQTQQTRQEDALLLELGYYISPPYRKKGYGTEACRAILSYGAENWSRRIFARIRADNSPSIRMAERLGFGLIDEEGNGGRKRWRLYEVYCS